MKNINTDIYLKVEIIYGSPQDKNYTQRAVLQERRAEKIKKFENKIAMKKIDFYKQFCFLQERYENRDLEEYLLALLKFGHQRATAQRTMK